GYIVTQSRRAHFAAHALVVNLQNLLLLAQSLSSQNLSKFVLGKRHALSNILFRLLLKLRRNSLQELLANFRATAATRRSPRAIFQLRERVDSLLMNGLNDRAFCDAVTSANHLAVRHRRDVQARIIRRSREKKLAAHSRQVRRSAQPVHVAMTI